MQSMVEALFQMALELPEGERMTLISRLLQSLPSEGEGLSLDDPQLDEKLQRQYSDGIRPVPWSELHGEA
jgi:hypothetical protein